MLKKCGILILRGSHVASEVADFDPIESRTWKVLTWKDGKKPSPGRSSVSLSLKAAHEQNLPSVVTGFCEKYL